MDQFPGRPPFEIPHALMRFYDLAHHTGRDPPKPRAMADRPSPESWRLCVVTDERLGRGRSHLRIAEAAIRGGADVIQLRDKTAPGLRLYEVALALRKLTREAKVPFIVNDRVDIALAVDAG